MIVLDDSAVVELLTGIVWPVLARMVFDREQSLHAPHLLDIEVTQVLRRWCARGLVTPVQAADALSDLADLPLERHPHRLLWERIWALRHKLTAYDAAYVALAEQLDAPLLTRDRRIAAASGR